MQNKEITIIGNDLVKYQFDLENKRVFIITTNEFFSKIFVFLFILLILAIFYDSVKDLMRMFSGYKSIASGDLNSGMTKVWGFTPDNMKRGSLIIALFFSLIVVYLLMEQKKEITMDTVPEDVKTKLKEQM